MTTDPRCLGQAPTARELVENLDGYGIALFSLMTLMTVIADLVFLEEIFYIYHKIPSSKRGILMWINGAGPLIASTSCIGMWVPRSTMFTDFTAAVYFAIVIHKFLLMMIKECGGQNAFLRHFGNDEFKLSTGPCCCCCLCLPTKHVTRRTLFVLKWGTFQFAFLRPLLMFITIVLWTNGNYRPSNMSPFEAGLWISIINGILTIIAMWSVGIMFNHVRSILVTTRIIAKFALYQIALIISQIQPAIINMVATGGAIPCAPPLPASTRGSYINEQLLILEMFILTILSRFFYRRRYEDLHVSISADDCGAVRSRCNSSADLEAGKVHF